MLERLFKFRENGTNLTRDTLAGLTTFMVMSYIIFVNPNILGFAGVPDLQDKGLPFAAALTSTCLIAAIMTLLMGLASNKAYAIAPGLGINAVVAFQLVAGKGLTMPEAMGFIVLEGVAITALVLTGLRKAVFDAVPLQLKQAIVIGIGFFILFIGLTDGGIVVKGEGTPVALGDLTSASVAVCAFGIVITAVMLARRWKAAILLGIVFTTVLAIIVNYAYDKKAFPAGTAVIPDSAVAAPDFSLLGQFSFGGFSKIGAAAAVLWIFSIMLSDFFDTMGTLIGVGGQAGYLDKKGDLPGTNRLLLVDSLAAVGGGLVSASSATTYIESGAGVGVGGRTGWVGVIIAICFFLAMFFSPIAGIVPAAATAPALVIVGYLMMRTLIQGEALAEHEGESPRAISAIDFRDLAFGLPAVLTMTLMPLTYSITNGIGGGFLAYVAVRLAQGQWRKVHWLLYVVSAAFLLYFLFPLLQKKLGW